MPDATAAFHGVLPALITPLTADGDAIDVAALEATVQRLIDARVGGLVPGGSTGEFTTLTDDERRQLTSGGQPRSSASTGFSSRPTIPSPNAR